MAPSPAISPIYTGFSAHKLFCNISSVVQQAVPPRSLQGNHTVKLCDLLAEQKSLKETHRLPLPYFSQIDRISHLPIPLPDHAALNTSECFLIPTIGRLQRETPKAHLTEDSIAMTSVSLKQNSTASLLPWQKMNFPCDPDHLCVCACTLCLESSSLGPAH